MKAILLVLAIFPLFVMADPSPTGYPVAVAQAGEISIEQFLGMIFEQVKAFGGLSWTMKVAAFLTILIGSMKVSALRKYWDKLGPYKAFASPVLSLALGVITLGVAGQISASGVFAYLFAGAGAIILHELLDAVKALPGVGPAYKAAIEFFQRYLKAPQKAPPA